ncbi:MAG: V-type ATP synthase subunit D [Nitrospiraceae bacterium]|nr:MAG: V-type ATP synthase subunit D [Nitrospiraceae bacterium]
MIIHPTRTNLLLLKEKAFSVVNSVGILKARRQALIREFLKTTVPFMRSREDIRRTYGKALDELRLSMGHEGRNTIRSVSAVTGRDIDIDIMEKRIWGLQYKEILLHHEPVRDPHKRGYDFLATTPHLEESAYLFERILELMIELATYENKLKRLSDEILNITRKMKVLEERLLPDLRYQIKTIKQYIGERERETYFRMKKFKELRPPAPR